MKRFFSFRCFGVVWFPNKLHLRDLDMQWLFCDAVTFLSNPKIDPSYRDRPSYSIIFQTNPIEESFRWKCRYCLYSSNFSTIENYVSLQFLRDEAYRSWCEEKVFLFSLTCLHWPWIFTLYKFCEPPIVWDGFPRHSRRLAAFRYCRIVRKIITSHCMMWKIEGVRKRTPQITLSELRVFCIPWMRACSAHKKMRTSKYIKHLCSL